MPITPTSIEAQAATQLRASLSRSSTLQGLFGVSAEPDPAAALLPLLFIVDTDDDESAPTAAPYGLLVAVPGGDEELARDLVLTTVDVEVELWIPAPAGSANAGEDYLAALNLGDIKQDLRADYDAGNLNFEIGAMSLAPPVRDDEWAPDVAGELGTVLQVTLEAYGD